MLDVRRMQVLRAVVTSGSVTAAAANLSCTPSAVSQQVAALEREAGLPLLERVGRGVRPTAAGRLLTEHAAVLGRQLAETETALADLRAGRTGNLSLRFFASAGAALVPPALAKLRAEHPGVRVDLKLIDAEDPLPEVVDGRADLAISVYRHPVPPRGVEFVPLLEDPYRAVLPRGHRLAAKCTIDLADLAEEQWINAEHSPGPCRQIVLDACASAGFTPDFTVDGADFATTQGFVAAGLGVSLIPRMGLGVTHPGVVIRRVGKPEPVRAIHAAIRESARSHPAMVSLIDALRNAA
ncbi:LysR family transcriptional regulator [Actinokineospora sp. G85]|uniref:LysR family transcriptional regulator n=1 Tax=Actinokineospora sp. G85 TaxID=3406626 RepID=UPI003C757C60